MSPAARADLVVDTVTATQTKVTHLVCLACYPTYRKGTEFSSVCGRPFPASAKRAEEPSLVDCAPCLALVACTECRAEDAKHRCGGSA